jgi:Glycosyl transferase family 11
MLDSSRFLERTRTAVVARLCGGLGNQLFQFAAGRSLAERRGAQLILDATVFTLPNERRKFALEPYPIAAKVTVDGYAYPPTRPLVIVPRPAALDQRPAALVDRIVSGIGQRSGMAESAVMAVVSGFRHVTGRPAALRVFREKTFDYDSAFETIGAQTYIDGYWQSERYFNDVCELIRRELTLPYGPNAVNAHWLGHIQGTNSVCVHVRRGDYLLADHFSQHGICSADYYARAMRAIVERVENAQFFIFSDDLEWCGRHIAGRNVAYVDANPPDAAHDELRLMSACRHHIIANSSLSWWGAWLARHERQIVIGPDPWFSAVRKTPDLFPDSWIALPRD